jgi:hypothetical protein
MQISVAKKSKSVACGILTRISLKISEKFRKENTVRYDAQLSVDHLYRTADPIDAVRVR